MPPNIVKFENELDLKKVLAGEYRKQIENYFGNEKKALRFLSGVIAAVQRNPKLLECTPVSVINSFMTMAQLGLMPSDVSGEAYVLPYKNKKNIGGKWTEVMEAQFQLGYKGLVTLFYRAGIKDIAAEIVYANDPFEVVNGAIKHTPDVFAADRGKPRGAYCIVRLANGGVVTKAMSEKEIMDIAARFSKSFAGDGKDRSPWNPKNDPQLWMWRKTVLRQCAKLVPQNETIIEAIAKDNEDSIIGDRLPEAKENVAALTMGAILKNPDDKEHDQGESTETGEQGAGKEAGAQGDRSAA